jgi:hypothetical protein
MDGLTAAQESAINSLHFLKVADYESAAKEQSLGLDLALFLISCCPQGSLGPPGYKPGPHLSGNLVDADIRKRNLDV